MLVKPSIRLLKHGFNRNANMQAYILCRIYCDYFIEIVNNLLNLTVILSIFSLCVCVVSLPFVARAQTFLFLHASN